MSSEYNRYLSDHIDNVKRGYEWLISHFDDIRDKMRGHSFLFELHDSSKYGFDEYDAYDDYFYGGNKSFAVVQKFKYAWLHHIHNNPHHWQYWVLQNDDEPEEILEMPYQCIVEMICDWWSFSWRSENLGEIFDWYEKHKGMKLGEKTRKTVEDILNRIRAELEKEGIIERKEDVIEHHGIKGQKWGVKNGPPYPINEQLKNKTPAKIETIENYKGKLYWLSEEDLDNVIIQPRVPNNFFVKNGYEDAHTKRLCFTPSIDQCLMAISQNLKGKNYNVYEPSEQISKVLKPNIGAVPDSDITGELWVTEPVKLKKTGVINVTGDDGADGKKFEYGDHTAELYGWNYNFV